MCSGAISLMIIINIIIIIIIISGGVSAWKGIV